MSKISLISDGLQFEGFKSADVKKSISSLAGTFSLEITEKINEEGDYRQIQNQAQAEILLNDERFINGYVEKRKVDVALGMRSVSVSGRDKLCDLIDCPIESKNFKDYAKGTDFIKLATDLCSPFGIQVTLNLSKSLILPNKVTISPGQTPFEVMEEQARSLGVVLIGNLDGDIEISEIGKNYADVDLVEGKNIKAISQDSAASNLFSQYEVLAQSQSDDLIGESASQLSGIAKDSLVNRYRPYVVVGGTSLDNKGASSLAEWELSARRAKAMKVTVNVATWFQKENVMWKPNLLVKIKSPSVPIDATMLIDECAYKVSTSGSFTSLSLIHKDSYKPKPIATKDEDDLLW